MGAIREAALPAPLPGQVVVRALWSGISRGTESLVFQGKVPESQRDVMRCPFQEGSFPAPVKYGYMNVGVVEAAGEADDESLVGRTVFCLHPHQDRYVVPAGAVTPVPDAVPSRRALLAANLETAVNGVWDARPSVGDRVVVVGGGVVGLLAGWLCAEHPGAEVTLVDPNPARREVAESLGMSWFAEIPSGVAADVVIHASGSPKGLPVALSAAAVEATIVELSWFGDRDVALPLGETFHSRRLTLRSSQVGRIPTRQAPRWDHARRMALVLELLRDVRLDGLLTGESAFHELPATMERLSRSGGDTLCHTVRYD